MKKRQMIIGLAVGVLVLMLVPLTVAATTNSEIIALLNAVVQGVLSAGRDAYCAAGVVAFCP